MPLSCSMQVGPSTSAFFGPRWEMRREISRLHREIGGTILYVTHDQAEALGMADKIVVMSRGEIQQTGSPVEIFNSPANPFVAKFVGQSNLIKGRWENGIFICGRGERTERGNVAQSFVDENLYPVKADGLSIVDADDSKFSGRIKEIEYQGFNNKIIMLMNDGNTVQVMADSRYAFSEGKEYGIKFA